MSLPKWVEEICCEQACDTKLVEALGTAYEALEKICDSIKGPPDLHYDSKGQRLPCLAEEAMRRIEELGK